MLCRVKFQALRVGLVTIGTDDGKTTKTHAIRGLKKGHIHIDIKVYKQERNRITSLRRFFNRKEMADVVKAGAIYKTRNASIRKIFEEKNTHQQI